MCRNKVAMVVMKVGRRIMRSIRPSKRCRSSGRKGRSISGKKRNIRNKSGT